MAITTQPGAKGSDLTTLLGTELADTFAITADDLFIDGLEGADTVTAAGAIDDLNAEMGDGNDNLTFSGDLTDSEIDFGGGNDTAQFENFDNGELIGGTGTDSFDFNRAVEESTIKGGTGDDDFTFDTSLEGSLVWGNSDDDTITVTGLTTGSTIYGGKQEDQITVAGATNTKLRGDKGDDTITVDGPLDNVVIQGNADDDSIDVTAATAVNTTVFGGKGNDDIDINGDAGGTDGAMLVRGDDGNDDIDITGDAAYTVSGGSGDDNIDSDSTVAGNYFGGKGDDTITIDGVVTADGTQNYASGDVGDDSIVGGAGADSIDGGTGDDTVSGAGGDDTVYGKAGDDSITVGAGDVNVLGGADDDTIVISEANLDSDDDIRGETGDDALRIDGAGDDLDDIEFATVTSIETVIIDDMGDGENAVFAARAQATGVRTIDTAAITTEAATSTMDASGFTSTAAVTFIGSDNEVDQIFLGGAGNDTLNSGADGQVSMTGNAGVDLFNFDSIEAGGEIIDLSGTDNFTLSANAAEIQITVTADYVAGATTKNLTDGAANADIDAAGFDVSFASVTAGTSGFDIDGTDDAATLTGSGLADSIAGGAAADSITGGSGNDTLTGDGGADTINAAGGSDTIVQILDGTAAVVTTVQNFGAGTAATTVDTYAMATLAELNAFVGDNDGETAIGDMIIGSAANLAGGALTLQVLTDDDQALGATTEIVGLSQTYADDAAALTGMATAGDDTFTLVEIDDEEGILISYITDAGDINIAVGQFGAVGTSSNDLDGLTTIAVLDGFTSFANLGDGELIVTA